MNSDDILTGIDAFDQFQKDREQKQRQQVIDLHKRLWQLSVEHNLTHSGSVKPTEEQINFYINILNKNHEL